MMPSFYEFFAGAGMARAGLGENWRCILANDIDQKKGASYSENWGSEHLHVKSVGALTPGDLSETADLAWASFPCQDLSLAGDYVGLKGERSGTFWFFWRLMQALADEARAPSVIVLENVCGMLTSHDGGDFAAIATAVVNAGYSLGSVVIDAIRFVPQSRPRVFFVAVRADHAIPPELVSDRSSGIWHPSNLLSAYDKLPEQLKASWIWWRLPEPPRRKAGFADLVEDRPEGVTWHSPEETSLLLSMMSPINRKKIDQAKRMRKRMVGGIYRRTRLDEHGRRTQRAEVRFDGVSGCLRTPAGGSSRQFIVVVEGETVRSRLLAPREAARLMGLPDTYRLPRNYNEAYHLIGDGVVVPVVRFLAANILEPLLCSDSGREKAAA